jgi:membrane protein implicated in regulation of membrane protease activity
MRFTLPPAYRPRHPLMRIAMAALGLAVLGALMVFGLIALAVLVIVGAVLMLVRAWRRHVSAPEPDAPNSQKHSPDVLEGEYVVVHEHRHTSRH